LGLAGSPEKLVALSLFVRRAVFSLAVSLLPPFGAASSLLTNHDFVSSDDAGKTRLCELAALFGGVSISSDLFRPSLLDLDRGV